MPCPQSRRSPRSSSSHSSRLDCLSSSESLGGRSVGLDDSVCAGRLSSFLWSTRRFSFCVRAHHSLRPSLPPSSSSLPPSLPPWVAIAEQMSMRLTYHPRACKSQGCLCGVPTPWVMAMKAILCWGGIAGEPCLLLVS